MGKCTGSKTCWNHCTFAVTRADSFWTDGASGSAFGEIFTFGDWHRAAQLAINPKATILIEAITAIASSFGAPSSCLARGTPQPRKKHTTCHSPGAGSATLPSAEFIDEQTLMATRNRLLIRWFQTREILSHSVNPFSRLQFFPASTEW
jgi:hypothetical protein